MLPTLPRYGTGQGYQGEGLARVLIVDDDPTARLTLKTVLEKSGYRVDVAASAAEAVGMLDQAEYSLVLSDLQLESPKAGLKVLSHARITSYQPATALITAHREESSWQPKRSSSSLLIEDLPGLLSKVASLIGERATRRLRRELRLAGAH
jgi:CheY-like chemotaxis protein